MDFFKKQEPTIVADTPSEGGLDPQRMKAPPMPVMPGAGGLTQMVERTLELEEENNRILKGMQRLHWWSFWIKVIVWLLILGLPVIFFQQIVDMIHAFLVQNPSLIGLPPDQVQKLFQGIKGQ